MSGILGIGYAWVAAILKRFMTLSASNEAIKEVWVNPPYQMSFDVYFWNVTNAEGVEKDGEKAQLRQVGPVAYDYFVSRDDVSFSAESVFYKNRQLFQLNTSRSTIDKDARIVTLNVPFVVITSMLDDLPAFMIDIVKILLKDLNYTTFTAKSAKELLWGYEGASNNLFKI